jgi:hypothetical protein
VKKRTTRRRESVRVCAYSDDARIFGSAPCPTPIVVVALASKDGDVNVKRDLGVKMNALCAPLKADLSDRDTRRRRLLG